MGGEPAHIHVKRDWQIVKFWLDPVSLEKNRGFKDHELNQIMGLVEEHQQTLLEAWHDYFNTWVDYTKHIDHNAIMKERSPKTADAGG
ncbi:DUF4160 domain-containing protein [Coleofasciculus sp. LEGE 07092]|uniref:DUF4160 domain-containing protein n=1 Tax=Coleofasciculus sp. LEGE 07092 TaxID=2777969 RepID=UPI0018822A30|nr:MULTISPECIES: DUF4160 domain-containing protein [unclassified Coleofasciculus]MBE9126629.1 DUF4160 domain-containing protein [Coleofasciculus sp. LEGE 07081]MBE9148881.1 DUF4160 domain-containing protein [Coleofasciculus sp. LEGE 07092]